MLRSFDYAAFAGVHQRREIRAEVTEMLREAMATWQTLVCDAFLSAYREAAAGCRSIPDDPALFDDLLDLFLLEKALYEICYEATNRPDWLPLPVQGTLNLLSRIGDGQTET